ncbi:hypothetical protein BT67DRAFT_432861 [Trichocladium antarcticum]|uniref:2EXR domain-containing protein n=1 Tax=Trichocladium antarcticum TaxID=1450529 RepID=A0AAN6ZF49_9PEZI|nr:hypothetical protein BT67DRAFT_432861 [Trichocladium antarcticum]
MASDMPTIMESEFWETSSETSSPAPRGTSQPDTFPQFYRLPLELQLIIFQMAAQEFISSSPRCLTLVRSSINTGDPKGTSPVPKPVRTVVRVNRSHESHAAVRTLTQLCHTTRKMLTGHEAVLYQPSMHADAFIDQLDRDKPKGYTPYPVLGSATRDIVLLELIKHGFRAHLLNGPMFMRIMNDIFGNKVRRIHLLNDNWPPFCEQTMDIRVRSTGRVYQFPFGRDYGTLDYRTGNHFGRLPGFTGTLRLQRVIRDSGSFADADASVFDYTSGKYRTTENIRHNTAMDRNWKPEPRMRYGEVMRMRRDGTLQVNAGVRRRMEDKMRLPCQSTKARLEQMVALVATVMPDLEYVSILGQLAPGKDLEVAEKMRNRNRADAQDLDEEDETEDEEGYE